MDVHTVFPQKLSLAPSLSASIGCEGVTFNFEVSPRYSIETFSVFLRMPGGHVSANRRGRPALDPTP